MTVAGIQIQMVNALQTGYQFQALRAKGAFAVEGMQNDAFNQVSKRYVVVFGQRLQDFQNSFLHANTGLNSFDHNLLPVYITNNVP